MFYTTRKRGARGFTLLEMLVTIAIIGILASVVLASMSGARARARDAQRISDIAQLQLVLEQYYNACRQYPAPTSGGALNALAGNGCPTGVTLGTFLPTVPTPPAPPTGASYRYGTSAGTRNDYRLGVTLETNDRVLQRNAGASYAVTCNVASLQYCVQP